MNTDTKDKRNYIYLFWLILFCAHRCVVFRFVEELLKVTFPKI